MTESPAVTGDGDHRSARPRVTESLTWRLLRHTLPIYVMSRFCVLAGAAIVAAEGRVDANLA